jgi:hypothetical protein
LEWLGTWYQQQCNGKWEHQTGMKLEPLHAGQAGSGTVQAGWQLRIDLRGTTAAGAPARRLALCTLDNRRAADSTAEGGATRWLRCTLNGHQFAGEGAEVEELIRVFRNWIDMAPVSPMDSRVLGAISVG